MKTGSWVSYLEERALYTKKFNMRTPGFFTFLQISACLTLPSRFGLDRARRFMVRTQKASPKGLKEKEQG